jgi:hydroxypyruvate reductase
LSRPHILAVAKLSPLLMEQLSAVYSVHDRLHETDSAGFAEVAPLIRGIAGGGESSVSRELMNQLPALEIVSIMGVGYDGVDVAAALERRIPVTHGAKPLARKVSGARLGIVGLGRIGLAIAKRAEAFGMSVAYTARGAKPDAAYSFYPTATALAAQVDFLIVITPGGAGTRHLINAEVLQALGPGGYLINVARGSVVDEVALIDALQKGVIAGAALDVFEKEPHVPEAFWAMDNVVLTPHIGSATRQTRRAMADLAAANLQAHFSGQPLLSAVAEWH